MRYELATNQQLWSIMKSDKECPIQLMDGVFQESVKRGLIKNAIIRVITKKKIIPKTNQEFNVSYEDLIQIGYEGALKAIEDFEPGRGTFTDLLFIKISQAIGMFFQAQRAQKRKGNVISFHNTLTNENEDVFELFLMDHKMNVEKTVIKKMELEEKLNTLSDEQRETFNLFFIGYTVPEIAKKIHCSRTRTQSRLQDAFIKMIGHKIDLRKLGVYERVSAKKQGA